MKLTLEESTAILQQEIEWCLENPDPLLNHDQQMGFINGLKQAQYLLRVGEQTKRMFEADGLQPGKIFNPYVLNELMDELINHRR